MHDGLTCHEYGEPCAPPAPPTERDGLMVGDLVHIAERWPAVIIGFTTVECDVIVRWTGRRPSLDRENTVCRKHARIVRVEVFDE